MKMMTKHAVNRTEKLTLCSAVVAVIATKSPTAVCVVYFFGFSRHRK